ncbi:LysR family transcriptional regulator [Nocardia aurantia]|uniref:Hydrogen peroxide-inducible genes activator n=1 Tax=Nocardia aurantia TaxID=2585199 RepID=A0A7K0DXQ6_9NOCA|nr:LysR family transcriptional regulator [Nocardia aurantia]MQY30491.1 Hydrogen peroxide-inducible genes activator [Nocardia aurantia]
MLDITRLRLLRTVVATGSLRASAAALGYTPSAASQQLAALQRQTGLRLVERSGRGLVPTTAGRALATESDRLFAELSRLDSMVGDLRAGRAGSLSIGYFGSVGAAWLPPVVEALRTEFPDLRLELRMAEFAEGQRDIEIFVADPHSPPPTGARVQPLAADPYVVGLHREHPLVTETRVRLADLADHPWIDNEHTDGPCRRVLLDACAAAGITPAFQVQTPDYPTAIALVATGIGVTVMPRLAAVDLPPQVVARPVVDPTPVRRIALAIREERLGHPAARRAAELFTAAAAHP